MDHWQVRRVTHPDAPELSELVGDINAFRTDTLFRHPLLTRVRDPARFADVEVLWDDLLRRGTRQPGFRLVRAGATMSAREVTRRAGIGNRDLDDVVAPNRVIAHYRAGNTVALQGLHHTNPHLARLANNIALALDHPVQVNAYLSPPIERGLDLHFDYHDVFVVQLGGCKRWRVWSPLPRTIDPVKSRRSIAAPKLNELSDPVLDVTLHVGDCLYLPRGYPHAAKTIDDHSEHLTIGLVAVTWQRALREAVAAEVTAGRLTGALPAALLEPGAAPDITATGLEGLQKHMAPASLRHWMAREIWRRQPATRLRPRSAPPLESSPLTFTPGPLLWLTAVGDRAVLGLGDRLLDMPDEALDFLSALLDVDGPVAPSQLKGLDDDSRSVVLRRLLAEGVLAHVR